MFLAAESGHVIHFPINEVPVLSGAGKGVIGIKLKGDDTCIGGALIGSRFDALSVETTGGRSLELRRGAYSATHRGGKGYEVVKRAKLTRALPQPIVLVDWESIEETEGKRADRNGKG